MRSDQKPDRNFTAVATTTEKPSTRPIITAEAPSPTTR